MIYEELMKENKIENYRRWKRTKLTPEEFKKTKQYLRPITARGLAVKLSILKNTEDLYYFLSICRDYKQRKGSFSKMFWGALKKK